MRVGCWIDDLSDDTLRFWKQIGIDDVDVALRVLPSYVAQGWVDLEELLRFKQRLLSFGLRIELINTEIEHLLDAYLQGPQAERQIEALCTTIRNTGKAGIPLLGLRPLNAGYLAGPPPGYVTKAGRGGYAMHSFDWDQALRTMDTPLGVIEPGRVWDGILKVCGRALTVAEESGVRICHHGNDPPIPHYRGVPHVLNSHAAFERLFASLPSKNNGMTFCVGARYESGEDILQGIRRFAGAGRIFHVHFRNVRGRIPVNHGYQEVFLDEGDINMAEVIHTLRDAGYSGVLNLDHVPGLTGDTPDTKMATAWAVGYMKALLAHS
jgi:mannonate dehydratase